MGSAAIADPIVLSVNPAVVSQDPTEIAGHYLAQFAFDDLNGITSSGQKLSVDFIFDESVYARVSGVTPIKWTVGVTFQTNGVGRATGMGPVTGYLINPDLTPGAPVVPGNAGSGWAYDGSFSWTWHPLVSGASFAGLHLDMTLPTTGFTLTGGSFGIFSNSLAGTVDFVAPSATPVPEPSTFALFAAGAALAVRKSRTMSRRRQSNS